MEPEIRVATIHDAEELIRFADKLFSEELPGIFTRPTPTLEEERDFIGRRLGPDNSTLLVAWLDGRAVGLLDFVGETLPEERHAGTFGLSVDGDHRGLGIGTKLIEALMEWAPAHGITRIQGWAWANNPRAISLYERMGFQREGVCRGAVISKGETIDVILLARLLGTSPLT